MDQKKEITMRDEMAEARLAEEIRRSEVVRVYYFSRSEFLAMLRDARELLRTIEERPMRKPRELVFAGGSSEENPIKLVGSSSGGLPELQLVEYLEKTLQMLEFFLSSGPGFEVMLEAQLQMLLSVLAANFSEHKLEALVKDYYARSCRTITQGEREDFASLGGKEGIYD